MEIIKELNNNLFKKTAITIGSYDGIHNGHREIIAKLVSFSRLNDVPAVLITFDPHPQQILGNSIQKFPLIMSYEQKMKVLESIGIDFVFIINFTKSFAKMNASTFLNDFIIRNFDPIFMIVGYNHHFGNQRVGNSNFLKNFCNKKSIVLNIVKSVSFSNKKISSSLIRECILTGDMEYANELLGEAYCIKGAVVNGSGRGKSLNFPTANVKIINEEQILPKIGVYFVRVRIIGLNTFGMCNFGYRPTYNEKKLVMEINLFHDNLSNLYGKELKVEFLKRIRDEKKFNSSDKLVKQLNHDKQTCLSIKAKYE